MPIFQAERTRQCQRAKAEGGVAIVLRKRNIEAEKPKAYSAPQEILSCYKPTYRRRVCHCILGCWHATLSPRVVDEFCDAIKKLTKLRRCACQDKALRFYYKDGFPKQPLLKIPTAISGLSSNASPDRHFSGISIKALCEPGVVFRAPGFSQV